eukprot:scaffold23690_cov32-Tisochrysis_lutea.AAC.5
MALRRVVHALLTVSFAAWAAQGGHTRNRVGRSMDEAHERECAKQRSRQAIQLGMHHFHLGGGVSRRGRPRCGVVDPGEVSATTDG